MVWCGRDVEYQVLQSGVNLQICNLGDDLPQVLTHVSMILLYVAKLKRDSVILIGLKLAWKFHACANFSQNRKRCMLLGEAFWGTGSDQNVMCLIPIPKSCSKNWQKLVLANNCHHLVDAERFHDGKGEPGLTSAEASRRLKPRLS